MTEGLLQLPMWVARPQQRPVAREAGVRRTILPCVSDFFLALELEVDLALGTHSL